MLIKKDRPRKIAVLPADMSVPAWKRRWRTLFGGTYYIANKDGTGWAEAMEFLPKNPGGEVYGPAGTHPLSVSATLGHSVTVRGAGRQATVFDCAGLADWAFKLPGTYWNRLSDFSITESAGSGCLGGIYCSSVGASWGGLHNFKNIRVEEMSDVVSRGYLFEDTSHVTMELCSGVTMGGKGLHITSPNANSIGIFSLQTCIFMFANESIRIGRDAAAPFNEPGDAGPFDSIAFYEVFANAANLSGAGKNISWKTCHFEGSDATGMIKIVDAYGGSMRDCSFWIADTGVGVMFVTNGVIEDYTIENNEFNRSAGPGNPTAIAVGNPMTTWDKVMIGPNKYHTNVIPLSNPGGYGIFGFIDAGEDYHLLDDVIVGNLLYTYRGTSGAIGPGANYTIADFTMADGEIWQIDAVSYTGPNTHGGFARYVCSRRGAQSLISEIYDPWATMTGSLVANQVVLTNNEVGNVTFEYRVTKLQR